MCAQYQVYLLLLFTAIVIIKAGQSCPLGCECKQDDNLQPFGDIMTVICRDLTVIPDMSFLREVNKGKNLRFDENFLENVTKSNFPPGLNITVLNLNQNKELQVSDDAFLNLGISLKVLKIEAIDLAFNRTLSMFDPLFSLQELSLNFNNKHPFVKGAMKHIDKPLLQGEVAKSLIRLKLAGCRIETMSAESLGNLKNLKELDLSNNWFTSVPAVITHLPNLVFLELFYCDIETLQDNDFVTLTRLEALDLSSNDNLHTIEPRAFAGCEKSMKKLLLGRCNLTEVPTAALKKMSKLTHLDISENKFKSCPPGVFRGDYKVKELLVSAPEMPFEPDMFEGQEDNIEQLTITRMGLKRVPLEPLTKLTKLVSLSLEYNQISSLPERAFDGIRAVSINMANNPLSDIDPRAFEGLPPNLDINLRNTRMDNMEFLLGYEETAIESIDFTHANLVCRCSMKSSLNATLNIRVYGTCKKGISRVAISSTRLEGIIDQACDDERAAKEAAGNGGHGFVVVPERPRMVITVGLGILFSIDVLNGLHSG